MLDDARGWLLAQLQAAKPSFISKKPHFNFISAHYFWICGLTILGSILIYASAGGQMAYIDALFFASGANTQAGLNTIDVNLLNTFQQICLYFFTMTSNPITIHSSVVFLRLYWFEKRFQTVVREARQRRNTISKSMSRARGDDLNQAERGRSLSVRNIKVMHRNGQRTRMTNDGILLDMKEDEDGRVSPGSNGFVPIPGTPAHHLSTEQTSDRAPEFQDGSQVTDVSQGRITFARNVFRSDGTEPEVKLPPPSSPAHLAILERQRNGHDEETLRIPNPRDAERGMKPKRVEDGDAPEPEDDRDDPTPHEHSSTSSETIGAPHGMANELANNPGRRQTIKIEEPQRPRDQERTVKEEIAEEAEVIGRSIFPFSFHRHHKKESQNEPAPENTLTKVRSRVDTFRSALSRDKVDDMPYLSFTPTLGRNSAFPGLTQDQREELGGIEYRSLRTLAVILLCYFWGFSLFAITCFLPWVHTSSNDKYGNVIESAGVSKAWWGIFTANSAFNDLGLTLTPDSMNSFNDVPFILMIMSFLIIIGNTGFPVMLRFIIWILSKVVPRGGLHQELRFLLDHPRRCFTLLFPGGATWWLFSILIGLNVLDLLFFVLLDLNDNAVSHLPVHIRIVDGLFQAASTRTAGFSVVNISALHPAVQVSYMIMMYISVFPIAISIRRTNVYEEKSLGVYHHPDEEVEGTNENSAMSYVGTHLRRQLSFDLWYVFLGLFILAITEGHRIQNKDFDVFSVLFEIVSAYGTVGLSLGYPNVNASLCSQFTTGGKLIIIAMQIRGRHRGLPYGLDRAVLLPSESRFEKEAEEAPLPVLVRSATAASTGTALSASRSHLRSRRQSTNRGNINILTQFLHPGPPMNAHEESFSRRSRSFEVGEHHLPIAEEMRRRATEPVEDDTTSTDSGIVHPARRVNTTPAR
ncbi:potassium ion transporter [Colletotrichum truncatum]|uniref:Potassium ion transporter n=1 Tax=Colletotrichum truncatum TaxID=5467 RepID=A0ACC3YJ36_COLTU|nr:potassium ion transporter [Colletotrichum truncatum]KAF6797171.1 potassium ion transporter [Colletotrichum truncatum]